MEQRAENGDLERFCQGISPRGLSPCTFPATVHCANRQRLSPLRTPSPGGTSRSRRLLQKCQAHRSAQCARAPGNQCDFSCKSFCHFFSVYQVAPILSFQVVARKHFVPPYPDVVLFRLRWGEHPQSDRTTRSLLSVYLIHQTTPVVSLFNRSVHWFQTDGTVYSPLCALVSARNSQPAAPLRDCVLAHLFIRP